MKSNIKYIVTIFVIFLVILFLSKKTLLIAYIPSESMENTLQVHDLVLSNRLAYNNSDPTRGDIIVFPAKLEEGKYIKRIIGLPGETVSFQDGYVYINGKKLEENYIKEKWSTKDVENVSFVVPDDAYFVMGDNRNFSYDSRYWWQEALDSGVASSKEEALFYSFVERESIIAKGWIKIFKGFEVY